ncbi:MAG TPA: biotin/lipoyl-containing protein, partial [Ramlibacter sp.]|nr:biotin/lipoyl-containing protein [Ramlibacter sp.]
MAEIRAPLQAQVVQWLVAPADEVKAGDVLVILEAMKMEHEVRATSAGRVGELFFAPGDLVNEGDVLASTQAVAASAPAAGHAVQATAAAATPSVRADLQRVVARHALTEDAARPEAVARRRERGQRTARENVADLCDA